MAGVFCPIAGQAVLTLRETLSLKEILSPAVDIRPTEGRFCMQGRYCTSGGFLSPKRLQPPRNYLTRTYFVPREDKCYRGDFVLWEDWEPRKNNILKEIMYRWWILCPKYIISYGR